MKTVHLKQQPYTACLPSSNEDVGHRGYTLIEVLMVMSIFSIGVLGLMTLHVMAINSNNRAREIMSGSTILADQFEKLISTEYASQDLVPGTASSQNAHGYRIERTVTATQVPNIKKIDITVIRDTNNGRYFQATYYKGNRL